MSVRLAMQGRSMPVNSDVERLLRSVANGPCASGQPPVRSGHSETTLDYKGRLRFEGLSRRRQRASRSRPLVIAPREARDDGHEQ